MMHNLMNKESLRRFLYIMIFNGVVSEDYKLVYLALMLQNFNLS